MTNDYIACQFSDSFKYYKWAVRLIDCYRFPRMHKGDWISVTGTFVGITHDGRVVIKPSEIKNEAYKG